MKRALISGCSVSFALATTSSLSQNKKLTPDNPIYEHDMEIIDWYLYGMRGMWYGVYRGIYHDKKKPDAKCLSENVATELASILNWFAYGEFSDIFVLADSATNIYQDNLKYCGELQLYKSIKDHCN